MVVVEEAIEEEAVAGVVGCRGGAMFCDFWGWI